MKNKYKTLFSPIKIGNRVIKNRILVSNSAPHFLQGPETYPSEALISHNRRLAENGAAVVTFMEWANPMQRKFGSPDSLRMPCFDIQDPSVSNYITEMAEEVHMYDSLLSMFMMIEFPPGIVFSDKPQLSDEELIARGIDINDPIIHNMRTILSGGFGSAATPEQLQDKIKDIVEKLKMYKEMGYDMFGTIADPYLSLLGNYRTDEYGGSIENRARFLHELCTAIKKELGEDFLIEIVMPGEEDSPGGYTIEDTIEFAKIMEDCIDILQIREANGGYSHATTYNSKKGVHRNRAYCKALKEAGIKTKLCIIAGFQDPDECEEVLASGDADIIGMARAFFADPIFLKKAREGRADEITPCIRCNKCHGIARAPFTTYCSVNPRFGIEHKLASIEHPADRKKKVAIVGGGPAGMQAAITSAERGHEVVLFEKADHLGGQMDHAERVSFKWPIHEFRKYQIRMLDKLGVEVRLNTAATPEMIEAEGFDAVVAACGAEAVYPRIDGIEENQPMIAYDAYLMDEVPGKDIIIVGGSETGTELGMHLAEQGKNVTVLTRAWRLAHDSSPLHNITMDKEDKLDGGLMKFSAAWEKYENLKSITMASTTYIGPDFVRYQTPGEAEKELHADTIIVCGGMKPRTDEAISFSGCADQFFMVGDDKKAENMQVGIRQAYAAAIQI